MKDTICLIWFTGVISQYDVSKCNITELKINHNLLNKIIENYKADKYIALVNVRNDFEKQQYFELIKNEGLDKKLIFVFCDMVGSSFDVIGTLRYSYVINYYIDCSRKRIVSLLEMIEQNKLIHISQLLD